ncbi:MAG: NADH dehydrogenase [Lentisphaerae bacterium RIFOXYB12_FULL_65_16]|nr:MAG: NADH dehydrogenase [Lentisphaerae bacterium RIFOXYA12_64_32]OGV91137.1 MAG: NADH dehydrogenase [Lentisphaerae bacterium RIFOXYB12_FULL_65_16]
MDWAPAQRILQQMSPVGESDLIPLLQNLQDTYGYLPAEVLTEVSRQTGIPTSRMYGVITFYAQFSMKPRGRHTIRCCRGTACHVRGGQSVADAVGRVLGIADGETTQDGRFTFETVACLGTCFLAPVMMVDNDYFGLLRPEKVNSILDAYP